MPAGVTEMVGQWTRAGHRVALATVVATKRSAPQPIGTKMAVNDACQVWGAVSGGCVEGAVVEVAESVLQGAPPRLLHYGIDDGDAWDVGLPCGGEISVWVESYVGGGPQKLFFQAALAGERAAIVTAIDGVKQAGAKLFVPADGGHNGTLGAAELDAIALEHAREVLWTESGGLLELADGASVFIDVVAPPPRLIIVGAIDFAAQLSEVAKLAGWRPFVADPRARFATAERMEAGFDRSALDRVSAPIGLDLGALTAVETALSIMAEIVAIKHGRTGGRLIAAGGRIHDAAVA